MLSVSERFDYLRLIEAQDNEDEEAEYCNPEDMLYDKDEDCYSPFLPRKTIVEERSICGYARG